MIKLRTNLEAIEAMLYYWDATKDKEKVNERFLHDFAALPAMTMAYDQEFDAEAVRKVLSGITNREPLRPANKKEGRFFNNNLWMLEDLSLTQSMAQSIKVLNLDQLAAELSEEFKVDRTITVYFAPLHLDEVYLRPEKDAIILNFFRLQPDFMGGVNFCNQPLADYLAAQLRQLLQ
ncbi:MAG: hypothetical protein ACOX2K_08100 [Bacillota bacterium]|jgi:hypothetical protein